MLVRRLTNGDRPRPPASQRAAALERLGIMLPGGACAIRHLRGSMQTGDLLFLSGTLQTEGRGAKFIGRIDAELDVDAGREPANSSPRQWE
jgi:hypothetical protein